MLRYAGNVTGGFCVVRQQFNDALLGCENLHDCGRLRYGLSVLSVHENAGYLTVYRD